MRRDTLFFLAMAGFLLLGGGAVVVATRNWKTVTNAAKYLPTLRAAELKYGIPQDLLARQAYQESRFRDDIVTGKTVSSAGALGIMQIVPKWHPGVDPLNVPAAIDYAARYLVGLKKQFGSWNLALAAYNAGPGNVKKYGGVPPFTETQNYVTQITTDARSANPGVNQSLYA